MKNFWESLDVTKFIAVCITLAFIVLVFTILLFTPTLADAAWAVIAILGNSFTLLVGYYWGSSAGSKAKDAAFIPPPPTQNQKGIM